MIFESGEGRKSIQPIKSYLDFPCKRRLRIFKAIPPVLPLYSIYIPARDAPCGDDWDDLRALSVHRRWLELPELLSELLDLSQMFRPPAGSGGESSSRPWSAPCEESLRLFSHPGNEQVITVNNKQPFL